MYPALDLLAAVRLDQERRIRESSLVRLATLVRDCCTTGLQDRMARFLRLRPASC